MGNLDRRPTDGVTGTTGPGLALRSVFARLNRSEEAAPLFLSPRLLTVEICRESGRRAGPGCPRIRERYLPGKGPGSVCRRHGGSSPAGGGEADGGDIAFRLVRPTPNLQMVMDPRIPDTVEAYPLRIAGAGRIERVEWLVDGSVIGTSGAGERHFMWPLARGGHLAQARIWTAGTTTGLTTTAVRFEVK
jgi:penicillin-binding protein 1C